MNRLMLCSGQFKRDGWQTLDANPEFSPDFLATIPPLPDEVKAIVWDEIEWIHGIGTFYPWEARALLVELRAALSSGGKLILEQPDARECDPALHPEWVFGDQTPRNPLHMNKWIYTPVGLQKVLFECGFGSRVVMPATNHRPIRDFRIEARP